MVSKEKYLVDLPKRRVGNYEYTSHFRYLNMLLTKCVKAGHVVLDAGCGGGKSLEIIRKDSYRVGLDIKKENLLKARMIEGNNNLVLGDLEYLPFKERAFDFVFCQDVLEHVKSAEKTIREFSFVLKEKGVVAISTTNLLCPWLFFDTFLPSSVSGKLIKKFGGIEHYERSFRFSPWTLFKRLRENKFEPRLLMFGILFLGFSKYRIVFYVWSALDRLTNISLFKKFKEVMVVVARNQ